MDVSSISCAVDRVRPRTLARHITTCRHALQSIKKYLLEQVKLYQMHLIALYVTMLFKKVAIIIQAISLISKSQNVTQLIVRKLH